MTDGKRTVSMTQEKYLRFYRTEFGRRILEEELKIISEVLSGAETILSVGCGPAVLEETFQKMNPDIKLTGLDCSKAMLENALSINTVLGNAENMPFDNESFDAVFYLTSLEFIDDITAALKETVRILRQDGTALFFVLNPASKYFRDEYNDENSYIRRNIKHTDTERIKKLISQYFDAESSYFLGIRDGDVFETNDPEWASLVMMAGKKKDK